MSNFIHDDFLLQNKAAKRLFHDYAKEMPIIDYHCHLPPEEIANDKQWDNIAQCWLDGDHYKWRAMRANGVSERFCTGDASDRDKFDKFAALMPHLLRNPMYHWTQLELARYFDVFDLLSPETADSIWNQTRERLTAGMSARSIMRDSKVVVTCTTDDPIDSLEHHLTVRDDDSFDIKVLPTWRPDRAAAAEDAAVYAAYLTELGQLADVEINSFASLVKALRKRHDFFHATGCRLSDHGLDTFVFASFTEKEVVRVFAKVLGGDQLNNEELVTLQSAAMIEFGRMDAEKGWTQQLHIGAMRRNNTLMTRQLGPNTGFDSIGDERYARPLSRFLDQLNTEGALPKTIIYNLNPRDNEMLASMIGNFQDGSMPGKMQFGSGWWFLDQRDGIERQIEALSQIGLLSRFVGMLTDSRSFLSYTRHEYFRRVLCNMLGADIEDGLMPADFALVGGMVEDICFNNASQYFNFD